MEDERKRILTMLQQGQLTVDQAAELLQALEQSHRAEGRPGAEGAPREVEGAPTPGMSWGQFGRSLAQHIQERVQQALGGGAGGGASRGNYSTAKFTPTTLSRMPDGTSYTNYGHLVIADDVPEELLDRKIGDFTNFGQVQGPARLVTLLEAKCDTNFGVFQETGAQPDAPAPTPPRPPNAPPAPPRPADPPLAPASPASSARSEEAVLLRAAPDEIGEQIEIRCHGADLELVGAEEKAFRLLVRKAVPSGQTAPAGWEKAIPWSADRKKAKHIFTLGDPQDSELMRDVTFRLEIPGEAHIAAYAAGGDMRVNSLAGRLKLRTDGGDLTVSDVEGELAAESCGGDLHLTDIEGPVSAKSDGGDLRLADIEGPASAMSSGGDASASKVEGPLSIQASGGDVHLSDIEGPVSARAAGGDASASDVEGPLTVETDGGDIAVNDIEGPVTAKSRGGDVSIRDVEGDVFVQAEGGSVSLSDISGSVRSDAG